MARAEANLRLARANAALKDEAARARARARAARASSRARSSTSAPPRRDVGRRAGRGRPRPSSQQARVSLEYTTLRAPRRGVILAKLKEVGEIAVPGGFSGSGDLIRMANLDDLRGQVDVTESELAKVRLGQRAEVVPDAYPDRRYAAHVVKLYPQVDRQKGTLRVEVQIEQPDDFLWPDMSARITFVEPLAPTPAAARASSSPAAPSAATRDAPFAWAVVDGRVRRTPLTLGRDFGDQVQVDDRARRAARRVVVGDATALRDGQAVAVRGSARSRARPLGVASTSLGRAGVLRLLLLAHDERPPDRSP